MGDSFGYGCEGDPRSKDLKSDIVHFGRDTIVETADGSQWVASDLDESIPPFVEDAQTWPLHIRIMRFSKAVVSSALVQREENLHITPEEFANLEDRLHEGHRKLSEERNPMKRLVQLIRVAKLEGRVALHYDLEEGRELITHRQGQ